MSVDLILSMKLRKKVILYNPKAVFFDMPLALLAVGSVLDEQRYEVIILDGRLEENVEDKLIENLDQALCFGVTVITGAPIKDALHISKFVKKHSQDLPIIWGGWHTSLFPLQPMHDNDCIDITVQGQGEYTFKELVHYLDAGLPLEEVQGISYRGEAGLVQNAGRPLQPIDDLEKVNYDLIDVEQYFRKKGRRQFDYISSIGCYFRCSFCADPFVYDRKFYAIDAIKMVEHLAYYKERYHFDDVNFQDETFFTYKNRISDFAKGLIDRKLDITWAATMRADQGERLTDPVWQLCKISGLRRLLIGVESGSQEMLDWMQKDIKLSQVFYCADKCEALGIAVIFPFIVGFPDESRDSVEATVAVIKELNSRSEHFDTPIFYFKPYPGSAITRQVQANGYRLPETTDEWGDFDYIGSSGPWVDDEKERFFEAFKFYLKLGFGRRQGVLFSLLRKLGQWRVMKNQFKLPIEKFLADRLWIKKQLS